MLNFSPISRRIETNRVYTPTARFDGTARALTRDELRAIAPSVFAETAHESRSERYRPIPTIEVVDALAKEGFSVVGAKQSGSRDDDRVDFTKHLLRLRRLDDAVKYSVGGTVLEVLLRNANDGTAGYELFAGMFRIACLNSLVVATSTIDTVKVRHTGNVADKVVEGTYRVLNSAETALTAPEEWARIKLDRADQLALANAAHVVRFGDAEGNVPENAPIQPAQLLRTRRMDDTGGDLWTTFNVIQENAIKGGLHSQRINAETGQRRRVTTREIKGIDQDVKVNRALWMLTEHFAAQRKAA